MKKTIIVMRRIKGSLVEASQVIKKLKSELHGEDPYVIASTSKDAAATRSVLEAEFGRIPQCSSALNGAPDTPNAEEAIRLIEQCESSLILILTHDELSQSLPGLIAKHYKLEVIPEDAYCKPGAWTSVTVDTAVLATA